MKLRLHGNEIRVRLNRNEVAEFAEAGLLEDAVDFGEGSTLTYVLEASPNANDPKASFRGGVVRVELPARDAQQWVLTERVGISGEQTLGPDKRLSILVEKDFQCLHDSDESDVDAFPNPLTQPTN